MTFLTAQPNVESSSIILPAWATAVLSIIISTLITGVVGYLIHRSLDKFFKEKEQKEEKIQTELLELNTHKAAEKREQLKADVIEIVKAEISPINSKIDALIEKITKVEDGTLSSLRNDILTCYYQCCEKGYREDWDFENIHHLYDAYEELHGNSFVKDVMKRFDELPTKEEFKESMQENLEI